MKFGIIEDQTYLVLKCLMIIKEKLEHRDVKSVFVEHAHNSKVYRLLDLELNVIVESIQC